MTIWRKPRRDSPKNVGVTNARERGHATLQHPCVNESSNPGISENYNRIARWMGYETRGWELRRQLGEQGGGCEYKVLTGDLLVLESKEDDRRV